MFPVPRYKVAVNLRCVTVSQTCCEKRGDVPAASHRDPGPRVHAESACTAVLGSKRRCREEGQLPPGFSEEDSCRAPRLAPVNGLCATVGPP